MIDRPAPAVMESELTLVLPDGATRTVAPGTLPAEVVRSIGERLLKAAVAVTVNGEIQDLGTPLRRGGASRVLTERDPEALAVLRHSAAHVLATAVRRLRPDAHIGFGPAIDDGFYYDFEVASPFTPEDLDADEIISTYTDGPFIDLCRGPHVPDTGALKHFKLTHAAGAYWRGASN